MPHHKSCKKRLITNAKRNERNRENRAMMRTLVKQYRTTVGQASAEDKAQQLSQMYSLIDSQARKGLLPKQRASRLKSRLAAAAAK